MQSLIRLGERVVYRSRTGDYSLTGIVTATVDTINPIGVERGQVPPLTANDRVHLAIFTPGLPPVDMPPVTRTIVDPTKPLGSRVRPFTYDPGIPELTPDEFIAIQALGGTYQEFDVPTWRDPRMALGNQVVFGFDGFEYEQQTPGTWTFA